MSDFESHGAYAPQWSERLPSGELGEKYGPSATTYAEYLHQYKMWSWRPQSAQERQRSTLAHLVKFVADGHASGRQAAAFNAVYHEGLSIRCAAAKLGMHRDTLRTQLRRLKAKAKAHD